MFLGDRSNGYHLYCSLDFIQSECVKRGRENNDYVSNARQSPIKKKGDSGSKTFQTWFDSLQPTVVNANNTKYLFSNSYVRRLLICCASVSILKNNHRNFIYLLCMILYNAAVYLSYKR